LKITLRGFDHGSDPSAGPTEFLTEDVDVNPDGTYRFETEFVESQIYLTEVDRGWHNYQSEFAVVAAGATELIPAEPITVYETTEDYSAYFEVEELQIFFDLASEEAQIFTVYFITIPAINHSRQNEGDGQNVPFIAFPEGSTDSATKPRNSALLSNRRTNFCHAAQRNPVRIDRLCIHPESKRIEDRSICTVAHQFVTFFLPEGVEAEGTSLTDTGIQNLQGIRTSTYTPLPAIAAGKPA
jgi:hypothetical protein